MPENTRNALARVASKDRRDKQGVEIRELTELLPFSREEQKNLEKEAVIRLVMAYIRLRHFMLDEKGLPVPGALINGQSSPPSLLPAAPRALPAPLSGSGDERVAPTPPDPYVTSSCVSGVSGEAVGYSALGTQPPWGWSADNGGHQRAPVSALSDWSASCEINEGELLLEALQGFLILINKKGKVLYVSSNVEEYLGVAQSWLLGRSVLDCIHHEDVKELARQLELPAQKAAIFPQPLERASANTCGYSYSKTRDFYLRMRQYPNGAGSRKKPGNFVLVHWSGQVRVRHSSHVRGRRPRASGLVCVCRPVQSNSVLHMRLGGNMFISRHDMRMTYTYCDPRVLFLIGYDPASLLGRTVYQFHNPSDAYKCTDCHTALIQTGTGVSKYYRFLGRTGVWVWMQTRATIVSDTRGKPQYVVCSNYIISQKEGDRCHMMEQQQHHKQQQHQALPMADLTAKGAIDLVMLPAVTSPTSISSVDDDHDDSSYNHDDTGYNTAVSSTGSDCTSPSPLGGMRGMVGDLDTVLSPPDFQFTSDFNADSSTTGLYVPDVPVSIVTSTSSFQNAEVGSEGCSSNLSTNLSSDQSDPFLYSVGSASGCGEGIPNMMEDMELLEDLLEKFVDCDKAESTHSVESHLSHNDTEEETLFGNSLLMSPQTGVKGQVDEDSVSELEKQRCVRSAMLPQKPPSLLRTLLDKEGKALNGQPSPPEVVMKNGPLPVSSPGKICMNSSERLVVGPQNKDRRQRSLEQVQLRSVSGKGKQLVTDTVNLTQESSCEGEGGNLPEVLPDDLLDFAMQYCDSLADMDPGRCLEADVWHSTMDDLMASDSQNPDVRTAKPVSCKVIGEQSSGRVVASKCQDISRSVAVNRLNSAGQAPTVHIQPSGIHNTHKNCANTVTTSVKRTPERTLTGVSVCPVTKEEGVASMMKSPSPQTIPVPSPTCRVVSPALTDHRYSSARTLSPHGKTESPAGKRLCMESDRIQSGRGKVISSQMYHIQAAAKCPSQVSSLRCPPKSSEMLPGKIIVVSPHKSPSPGVNKTTVVVGQKLPSPPPVSPVSPVSPMPIPANGGGKPLTAMSELEKHLRGLAPPLERRSESEESLTPIGECGDMSARPFLERLLTGEISHETYRRIDYQLLYQERERRLSETCGSQSS